jgi:hypothetical protein
MLEVLDIAGGFLSLASTWRLFLPIGLSLVAWANAAAWFPVGEPRVALLVILLGAGVSLGAAWQLSHQRRRGQAEREK